MRPKKTKRVFMAESLNPERSISTVMRKSEGDKFTVCLCLPSKVVKTICPTIDSALNQMMKYRSLYKKILKG